jgi:Restriction endonuclease/GYF domain 2
MSGFWVIGRVLCVDGITRDVYEDSDGRQWVTGDAGRLFGLWLPREDEKALHDQAKGRAPLPLTASSTAPDANWFVLVNEKQIGPLTQAELEERAKAGQIGPDTEIRREGDRWRKARWVLLLDALFSRLPNPAPSASNQNKGRQDQANSHPMDRQSSETSPFSPVTPAAISPTRDADWFVRSQGQDSGPFTVDELKAKAAAGVLAPEDFVRKGHEEWDYTRHYPFLVTLLPKSLAQTDPLPPETLPSPLVMPAPAPAVVERGAIRGDVVVGAPGARVRPPRPEPNAPIFGGDTAKAAISACVFAYMIGMMISAIFKVALFWGVVSATALIASAVLLLLLFIYLRTAREKQRVQREKLERETLVQRFLPSEEERRRRLQQAEEEERRRKEQVVEVERRRKEAEESAARAKWKLYYESITMDEISRMTGRQFEEFLARLFSRMGYRDTTLTATNDQGGDLLCLSPAGVRAVIQAKRWKGTVGNSAVQEVYAAMALYTCTEGMVVTNSTFTDAAHQLAKATGIALRDGRWLEEQIRTFLPREIPEFNWDQYDRVVKDWHPVRAGGSRRPKSRRYWRRRWY